MRMHAPLLRKVVGCEVAHQQDEEKIRLKEAAEKFQKELERYCPSVQYPVHGTYLWRSMVTEEVEAAS